MSAGDINLVSEKFQAFYRMLKIHHVVSYPHATTKVMDRRKHR